MYHADRDNGKCDLHGGRRQEFIEQEGQNQPGIELNGRVKPILNNVMHWRPKCRNQNEIQLRR